MSVKLIISTIMNGRGRINIDGRDFVGDTVTINGDKVIVDGVEQDGALYGPVSITVHGDVNSIDGSFGNVEVNGSAGSVKTMSGDAICGDVSGSISTMSGDVICAKLGGNASSMSGDIRTH